MEEKKDTSFRIRWGWLVAAVFLHLFIVCFSLFGAEGRRDRFHSALLGTALNLAFCLMYYLSTGSLRPPQF